MKTSIRKHQHSAHLTHRLGVLLLAIASTHIARAQTNTGTGPNGNVVISNGTGAALSITSGTHNSAFGNSALNLNTTGSSNTALGSNALKSNISGSNNTAVGMSALLLNTGNGNTALGLQALRANTIGSQNTASGVNALFTNTTGSFNTATGREALNFNTTGAGNVANGFQSLRNNTTGGFNVAVGDGALLNNTLGGGNIALGEEAGFILTEGSNNIRIGNKAGGIATENGIIRIGESPVHTDTFLAGIIHGNGSGLTGITGASLAANSITSTHIAAGTVGSAQLAPNLSLGGDLSLPATTVNSGAILVGGIPLMHTFGTNNIFVGLNAGNRIDLSVGSLALPSGNSNTAVGTNALGKNRTASKNVAIGHNALSEQSFVMEAFIGDPLNRPYSTNNVAVGFEALKSNQPISQVVQAGASPILAGGFNNTAIGTQALKTNTIGTDNTATGASALFFNNSGSENTAFGSSALLNNTTGSGNIALGEQAGLNLATGNDNIRIGNKADGISSENGIIRIGESPTHTDTFLAGVIHGDGSGLTGITGANLASNLSLSGSLLSLGGNLSLPFTGAIMVGASTGAISLTGSTLLHSFGSQNLFVGLNAGNRTMTGSGNTASGVEALRNNSTGVDNTANGGGALDANNSGSFNTAAGRDALGANTAGGQNTALGVNALGTNSTASFNTATGVNALRRNTTGANNTACGKSALEDNTVGSDNIALGFRAGENLTTGSNNINIGHVGVAAEAGTIRVGTAQTRAFVAGIRGRTTGSNNAIPVVIDSAGQLGTISSSRRYKEDIQNMGDSSARLQSLRPVTFRYKKPYQDGEKPIQYGLIAEEVAVAFPELAVFNDQGQPETVKYHDLVPMLLNEYLKEHRRVEAEVRTNAAQAKTIAEQEKRIAELEARDIAREDRLTRLEKALGSSPQPAAQKVVLQSSPASY